MRIIAILGTFIAVSLGATALFASAAALGVTSEELGSGQDDVTSCDDAVTVSWATVFDTNAYVITNVVVAGIDNVACLGAEMKVTVAGTGGTPSAERTVPSISTTSHTLDFSSEDFPAEDVEDVFVVITGP